MKPGDKLAHYEISRPLGKGGMGEVYLARDTKLGRDVALKLLPDDLAHDPERLARFEREAKLLASLSHPGIAALHGLEEADGRVFITMELAEGEDPVPGRAETLFPFEDWSIGRFEMEPGTGGFVASVRRENEEAGERSRDRSIRIVQNWQSRPGGIRPGPR